MLKIYDTTSEEVEISTLSDNARYFVEETLKMIAEKTKYNVYVALIDDNSSGKVTAIINSDSLSDNEYLFTDIVELIKDKFINIEHLHNIENFQRLILTAYPTGKNRNKISY